MGHSTVGDLKVAKRCRKAGWINENPMVDCLNAPFFSTKLGFSFRSRTQGMTYCIIWLHGFRWGVNSTKISFEGLGPNWGHLSLERYFVFFWRFLCFFFWSLRSLWVWGLHQSTNSWTPEIPEWMLSCCTAFQAKTSDVGVAFNPIYNLPTWWESEIDLPWTAVCSQPQINLTAVCSASGSVVWLDFAKDLCLPLVDNACWDTHTEKQEMQLKSH